ncbi:hypothetical protein PsYK624_064860 [Phanerochaete sordida]|uniref:Uncharacterized protein n=1 Tax=Phanerochaete sordida TaxID=48140 RepID=A0A9P3LCL5_9APHY|nr:hypothetical protein PsYK624_064860 [Phanerochaete sordida]
MVPDAGDVVAVGSPALVAWNASAMPLGSAVISRIDLYHNTTTAMSEYVANLAENVDPRAGAINYTVPDVQPGTYTVVIGGVDGPCSGVFRIEPRWKTPAMPDGGAGWTLGVDGLVGDIPQRPAGASPLQQHSLHARAAHHETGVLSSRPKHSLDNLTVQAPASGPSGANLFHGRQFGGMRLQVAAA